MDYASGFDRTAMIGQNAKDHFPVHYPRYFDDDRAVSMFASASGSAFGPFDLQECVCVRCLSSSLSCPMSNGPLKHHHPRNLYIKLSKYPASKVMALPPIPPGTPTDETAVLEIYEPWKVKTGDHVVHTRKVNMAGRFMLGAFIRVDSVHLGEVRPCNAGSELRLFGWIGMARDRSGYAELNLRWDDRPNYRH